jgi:crotonobetainyl-CoA:carnitine CoA-transferase CaiB-like acyl-CoA transferase
MSSRAAAALAGCRVLDLSHGAYAYAGRLLADLGADVVKIEPPGGEPARRTPPYRGGAPDPERSLLHLYMNAGKRGIVLDLMRASDRERFRTLAAGADLVIESLPAGTLDALGLGHAALARTHPALVLTSITGFGQTGPRAGWRSSDLVIGALGGALGVIGFAEDPPVRLAGDQAQVVAATCAAAASLIALRHAARTGAGQHVDVSNLETIASIIHTTGVSKWLEDGIVPRRAGAGLLTSVPSGAYACRDGSIYLMVNRPAHWRALSEWIHEVTGNQEVLDEMFHGPSAIRLPYRELLDLFISELMRGLSVEQAYREGQRRHLAVTPVRGAAALARDEHLAARNFFVGVDIGGEILRMPGAPYRPSETPCAVARRAPRLGEHRAEVMAEAYTPRPPGPAAGSSSSPARGARHALEGLRIVEFGAGIAVPWLGRILAWCGAETIKVESKNHPDVPRLYISPKEPEKGIQPQLSPWFTDWNAGKRFVSLDLTRPDALRLCRDLVARSDVVVANYSTGVLEKLGLGYAELAARDPRLVMLQSTGLGGTGPDRGHVTWGSNIEALSGLATLSGFPQRDCTVTHFAYADPLSALHALVALMAALRHRDATGRGQHIDLAQLETLMASIGHVLLESLADSVEPPRLGNASRCAAPHGCYPCAGEDRWLAIAVESDAEWERFRALLGHPDWTGDPRFATLAARIANACALDAHVAAWTRGQRDCDAMAALQAAGVAAGVVQDAADLYADPQLRARSFFEHIPHFKKGQVTATAIPLGLTGTPGRTAHAGEAIGQDNEYVFRELLGIPAEEYARCVANGSIEVLG